jgi:hypothetical protein
MSCDLGQLSQSSQPWAYMDPKTVLGIQVGLMCDALNGIDPTTELDPLALRKRFNCFAMLSEAQLMGIFTVLWAQFLKMITTACVSGGTGAPSGTPPCNFSIYIQQPGPNFGLWLGDSTGWSNVIAQGP